MGSVFSGSSRLGRARRIVVLAALGCLLTACARIDLVGGPHLAPLPNETAMLLGKKRMELQAPVFVRIFKEESELEVWKQRDDGRFYHFKTYPICNWSGELGPKLKEGDMQAPEGFYTVAREQMNPNSKYHLAFNLGYPNPYDKSNRRTGDALMIHGGCGSSGCYAMTDALMEELYALVRESFAGGQDVVHVHAFPFRMTAGNMARHSKSKWRAFWRTLKEGYDYFELTRQVPSVAVCNRRYMVNVKMPSGADPGKLNPAGACPAFKRPPPSRFTPKPGEQVAEERIVVPGKRLRVAGRTENEAPMSGLTMSGLTKTPGSQTPWWRSLWPKVDIFGATEK